MAVIGLLAAGCKQFAARSLVGEVPGEHRAFSLGHDVECEFVWIPPGTFTPAPTPGLTHARDPVVIAEGFWITAGLITQADWQKITGEKFAGLPPTAKGKTPPTEVPAYVSWYDCQKFLGHLTPPDPGWNFELSGETEWEYACRAGSSAPVTTLPTFGAPAGRTMPGNAWSVRDMHGDVEEWCRNSVSPNLPMYAARGRSAVGDLRFHTAARNSDSRFLRHNHVGFRIVLVRSRSVGPPPDTAI